MTWLLLEILAFVVAAAGFGVVIGLGLSAAGADRKAVGQQRAHQGLLDQIQALEQSQRLVEVKAEARSAAEAAVRGDLEGRLVEIEATSAEYRARAEAAERQLRLLQTPDYASPLRAEPAAPVNRATDRAAIEKLEAALAEAAAQREAAEAALAALQRDADAARAIAEQEIASLGAQLAAAEKVRAKSEAELALAHARAEAVMRSAAALMGGAPVTPAPATVVSPPATAQPAPPLPPASAPVAPPANLSPPTGAAAAPIWDPPLPTRAANGNSPAKGGETLEPNGNGNGNGNGPSLAPGALLDAHDRPPALTAPRGGRADDLRRIRGIGPRNEGVLNALGLYHYEQIASLSDRNVNWLDSYFRFPGRIEREDWVGQAKALVAQKSRAEPSDKVHPDDAGF